MEATRRRLEELLAEAFGPLEDLVGDNIESLVKLKLRVEEVWVGGAVKEVEWRIGTAKPIVPVKSIEEEQDRQGRTSLRTAKVVTTAPGLSPESPGERRKAMSMKRLSLH